MQRKQITWWYEVVRFYFEQGVFFMVMQTTGSSRGRSIVVSQRNTTSALRYALSACTSRHGASRDWLVEELAYLHVVEVQMA
jgi:hypothetical protein